MLLFLIFTLIIIIDHILYFLIKTARVEWNFIFRNLLYMAVNVHLRVIKHNIDITWCYLNFRYLLKMAETSSSSFLRPRREWLLPALSTAGSVLLAYEIWRRRSNIYNLNKEIHSHRSVGKDIFLLNCVVEWRFFHLDTKMFNNLIAIDFTFFYTNK